MSDGISMIASAPAEFTGDELQRARLAVCEAAESNAEAREFLLMLGLI